MTIINNNALIELNKCLNVKKTIETKKIPHIHYENPMKLAIRNNDAIEEKLNVIIMMSNPCNYNKRVKLTKEFIHRMEYYEEDIILYIVEYIYPGQTFSITEENNPRHLQVQTNTEPLWHKENALNVGINTLLPKNWKAVAWIDADLEFESTTWATDTLKILNGTADIVQLFSHCNDMNENTDAMSIFQSFGHQYVHKKKYDLNGNGINFWHPGFAWACTKKAYDKMGGLYENGILGSGDHIMTYSYIKNSKLSIHKDSHIKYFDDIANFELKTKNLRIGYTPGIIKHHFHGSKVNRKYTERWKVLVKHNYDPYKHITTIPLTSNITDINNNNKNELSIKGIIRTNNDTPNELIKDILNYFKERNEDE